MFQFKQFSVDQTNCAMKINTDGVLLGALTQIKAPQSILDIGTGTGVIALMFAQRFADAQIDAVEIDQSAADTASQNFSRSKFSDRLKVFALGFEQFFKAYPDNKYDLIISNPPFYINSLHSPEEKKQLAKHADENFFKEILSDVANHLTANGSCWLVLPPATAQLVRNLVNEYELYINDVITISSFKGKDPHREIISLSNVVDVFTKQEFVIYDSQGVHSEQYKNALIDFFTIF
ncbi:tRNA1(Val) (adenine(37)-N6)-methyltransferase [Mucilaginibacter auburnensis]|uniref:tRNA1(Val) (adenine(37)-N6)-methyltransferase n=1 Tax=Mucilaginibacter auburnensis TaxID=1457233 RepID=A0A2H9VVX8_9SPHI|nr:methyltransferase [Mucilaginibacter auburnensis]PJJ84993.1 tRNA1Val (adenine37-N6)-methyltransferase [Mucilaginibacter auburnensis]